MNLSDVKTQSPPESGLPSGVHYCALATTNLTVSAIVYLIFAGTACSVDVKEYETHGRRPRRGEVSGKKGEARLNLAGFLSVRRRRQTRGKQQEKTGEIARGSGESCKLENFPRPYYLRRDHRPAPRELSGIPRPLNTPPSYDLSVDEGVILEK